MLHYADVPAEERAWFSAVPITSPRLTLNDCAKDGLAPELLQQAAQQALRRALEQRSRPVGYPKVTTRAVTVRSFVGLRSRP